jgi:hypothetical protein
MSTARVGAVAGWLTLVGILAFEVVLPMVVAGPRVTGSNDRAVVEAYYAHDALAWFALGIMAVLVAFLVFVTALREDILGRGGNSLATNVGWAAAVVAAGVLLVKSGLSMAAVRGIGSGSDVMPTFFAYEFVYHSAVYAMEAVYPLAFAIGLARLATTPRWYVWLAVVVSVLQVINFPALLIGTPDAATLPGNILFAAWIGATAWLLGRPAGADASSFEPAVA